MRRNPFPLVGFRSESRRAFAAAFTVLISLLPASNRTDHLSIFVPSAARGSEAPGRWSHEAALCDSISTVTYAAIGHDSQPAEAGHRFVRSYRTPRKLTWSAATMVISNLSAHNP